MEWNETVVSRIHSVFNIKVEEGKGGRVNRRFSGLVFAPHGKVVYYMNGEEYVSDGTNVLYLPAGGNYTYISLSDDVCPQINFDCDFDRCEFLSFPVSRISVYEEKFENLRKMYYNENGTHSHHACLAALYDILTSLDSESGLAEYGEYSRAAIGIMREEYSDAELSNDSIAARLNISTVYFRKVFQNDVGMPPIAYLRKLRIERAKELLRLPGKRVGEVAFEVGYSGIYSFSRVFKRETGMTPGEYADRYKDAY